MTTPSNAMLQAAEALLAKVEQQTTRVRLPLAIDQDYWRGLNSGLGIGRPEHRQRHAQVSSASAETWLAHLKEHGYFRAENLLPTEQIAAMRMAIERLRKEGWPAVFAFVYDEFWSIVRTPPVVALLAHALGDNYTQVPHIWAHYVLPGSSGWPPHTDAYDGPDRLSVWIPLSEATVDNGCMFLIPRDRTPERIARNFHAVESFSFDEVNALLHNVRPLPAAPGSLLCWESGVVHWGTQAQPHSSPRISMALEFFRAGRSREATLPLMDGRQLPAFDERLRAIGKGILGYDRFEAQVVQFRGLATELLHR